jgi:tetratricopeptide (TPR) repeat protein
MPNGSIKLDTSARRAAILSVAAILCLTLTYFSAKWFFANTIASRAAIKQVADFAVGLAPADPQTHLASAVLHEKSFLPEDLPKSLAEYERAAALSPSDFRLWYELGKARERAGDARGAEFALRRALELAPNYSHVQWALGNFLLRQGKSEEAFTEIRKAAGGDKNYANPAVASAWQIYEGDLAELKRYVGDSAHLKAALAALLAREKRYDEALEIWNGLPETEKKTAFKASGEEIYQKMIEAKKYRDALQIYSQISESSEKTYALGRIANGGFESDVNLENPGVFEWQIAGGVEPQIGIDNTQKHGGNLSLAFIFKTADGKGFRSVQQTAAVEAGKKYTFEVFYKADLKAPATLRWEIADAGDGKILASTDALSANADWTALKTDFLTGATTEAVNVRLARADCNSTLCPISGRVWFDDFSLSAAGQ